MHEAGVGAGGEHGGHEFGGALALEARVEERLQGVLENVWIRAAAGPRVSARSLHCVCALVCMCVCVCPSACVCTTRPCVCLSVCADTGCVTCVTYVRSARAASAWWYRSAVSSGVMPSGPRALGSAPRAMSASTAEALFCDAAKCSTVPALSLSSSRRAPAFTSCRSSAAIAFGGLRAVR